MVLVAQTKNAGIILFPQLPLSFITSLPGTFKTHPISVQFSPCSL